jgi:hypothetical protein
MLATATAQHRHRVSVFLAEEEQLVIDGIVRAETELF